MIRTLIVVSLFCLALPASAAADGSPKNKKKSVIRPVAQLQLWGTVIDQDQTLQADPATYGDPEADPGFSLPRARFGVAGRHGNVRFRITGGFESPYDALTTGTTALELVDAYGRWGVKNAVGRASITGGAQKIPFSRDNLISSKDLVFQERAVATSWLVPSRELGVSGSQGLVLDEASDVQVIMRGGVYNGNGSYFGDTDPGVMVAGRIEMAKGDAYKTWSKNLEDALGVAIAAYYNPELATRTRGLEADMLARLGRVSLQLEAVHSQITPTDTVVTAPSVFAVTNRLGLMGQASVWMTVPDRGGIEAALRIASFDDAAHLADNGDVTIMHGGLTWRDLSPGFNLGGGVIHRIEREGRQLPNDSVRLWAQVVYPAR